MCCRSIRFHLRRIGDIWAGQYPTRPYGKRAWGEKVLMTVLLMIRSLSLAQGVKHALWPREAPVSKDCRRGWIDLYVLLATGGLIAFLFLVVSEKPVHWVRCWAIAMTTYLLVEMLATTLCVQFVEFYDRNDQPASPNRSIALLGIGYVELVIGFAIFYLVNDGVRAGSGENARRLTEAWDAVYFSLVTITTLGYGDWAPRSQGAKALVCTEVLTGLALLVVMLGAFLARLKSPGPQPTHKQIEERARQIWEKTGHKSGQDQHNWYQAETELRAEVLGEDN